MTVGRRCTSLAFIARSRSRSAMAIVLAAPVRLAPQCRRHKSDDACRRTSSSAHGSPAAQASTSDISLKTGEPRQHEPSPIGRRGLDFFSSDYLEETQSVLAESILGFCNEAITLSRQSHVPHSFYSAKADLRRATDACRRMIQIQRRDDHAFDGETIAYETYLIRSSYAHVVRTIGALTGREFAVVSGEMMLDYLDWEQELLRLGIQSADGTQAWMEARRKRALASRKGKEREEDLREAWLISGGPFLQDFAPTLYDLIFDLTTVVSDDEHRRRSRGFKSEDHLKVACKLMTCIRQFGKGTWSRHASAEWKSLRNPPLSAYVDDEGAETLIQDCAKTLSTACREQYRLVEAIQVWLLEVAYCNGSGDHSNKMLDRILKSLRHTRVRIKMSWGGKQKARDPIADASQRGAMFDQFARSLALLAGHLESGQFFKAQISRAQALVPDSKVSGRIELLIRLITHSSELLTHDPIENGQTTVQDKNSIAHLDRAQHSIRCLVSSLVSTRPIRHDDAADVPLTVKACNVLIHSLTNKAEDVKLGLLLLKAMVSSANLPLPDQATLTILLINARRAHDHDIRWRIRKAASIVAQVLERSAPSNQPFAVETGFAPHLPEPTHASRLVGTLSPLTGRGDDGNLSSDVDPTGSFFRNYFVLLRDAVDRNDSRRLIGLIGLAVRIRDATESSTWPSQNEISHTGKPLEAASEFSAAQILFSLYPSLHINRVRKGGISERARRKRWKEYQRSGTSIQDGESRWAYLARLEDKAPFHIGVLISMLHLLASQGATGLAERFWRMLVRSLRRKQFAKRKKGRFAEGKKSSRRGKSQNLVEGQLDVANLTIPIQAFTIMFHLYGRDIYRATNSTMLRSGRPRSQLVVRGWGRLRSLQADLGRSQYAILTDRVLAARAMTMHLYQQSRTSWMDSDARLSQPVLLPDIRFFNAVQRVFRKNASPFKAMPFEVRRQSELDFLRQVANDMKMLRVPVSQHLEELSMEEGDAQRSD